MYRNPNDLVPAPEPVLDKITDRLSRVNWEPPVLCCFAVSLALAAICFFRPSFSSAAYIAALLGFFLFGGLTGFFSDSERFCFLRTRGTWADLLIKMVTALILVAAAVSFIALMSAGGGTPEKTADGYGLFSHNELVRELEYVEYRLLCLCEAGSASLGCGLAGILLLYVRNEKRRERSDHE